MTSIPAHSSFDDIAPTVAGDVPPGFRPINIGGPFMVHNGPLYGLWTGQRLLLGFRVEQRHTNPLKMCHGGMLASCLPKAWSAPTGKPPCVSAVFSRRGR